MGEDEGESSHTQPFRFFTALIIIHLFIYLLLIVIYYTFLLIFKDKLIEIEKEMVSIQILEEYLTSCLCSLPLWGLRVPQALPDIYFLRIVQARLFFLMLVRCNHFYDLSAQTLAMDSEIPCPISNTISQKKKKNQILKIKKNIQSNMKHQTKTLRDCKVILYQSKITH